MTTDYDSFMDELTQLNIQKQSLDRAIAEITTKIDALNEQRANELLENIIKSVSELKSLGFHLKARLYDVEFNLYEWRDLCNATENAFRIRKVGDVIVD